ncbi:hypothetical protein EDC96DRAFT_579924 [Choanephora cucurbitarum]|nr:hypothetical protein EDC96DRAFT_579924 [Choanephora cucurbitarum]
MYPCISCSAVFNSEEEKLYHLKYDCCVSVAGQAALSARRNEQRTITGDALAAVMAAADMPVNMGMDEDIPPASGNEAAVGEAVVYENVDSEMTNANNTAFNEFMCLLDGAKTARLYQRKIFKLVNKMLNESADPDVEFTSLLYDALAKLMSEQLSILVIRQTPSPDVFRKTIKRDTKCIVKHDICVNGCFMYPDIEPTEVQAALEDVDREDGMPLPDLILTRQMAYTSLGSALT